MTPRYRGALFDLDDTLFDHQWHRREALAGVAQVVPALAGIDVLDLEAAHDRHLQDTYQATLDGRLTLAQSRTERMRRLLRGFGAPADDALADRCEAAYREGYDRDWRTVAGARELLAALRDLGLRIGIVTNGFTSEQLRKIDRIGIGGAIDHVFVSEAVGFKKPERPFFEHALAGIGLEAGECIVIGDLWPIDIQGAVDAGIDAIWLNRYGRQGTPHERVVEVTSLLPTEDMVSLFLQNEGLQRRQPPS